MRIFRFIILLFFFMESHSASSEEKCVTNLLSVLETEGVKNETIEESSSIEDYKALLDLVKESINESLHGMGELIGTSKDVGRSIGQGIDLPPGVKWIGRIITGHKPDYLQMEVSTFAGLVVSEQTHSNGDVIVEIYTSTKKRVKLNLNELTTLKTTPQEFIAAAQVISGVKISPPKKVDLTPPVAEAVQKRMGEYHRRKREVTDLEQYRSNDLFQQTFGERYERAQESLKEWEQVIQILERQHGIRINRESGSYEAWDVPIELALPKHVPEIFLHSIFENHRMLQAELIKTEELEGYRGTPHFQELFAGQLQSHQKMIEIFKEKINVIERQYNLKFNFETTQITEQQTPAHLRIPTAIPVDYAYFVLSTWREWKAAPADLREIHLSKINNMTRQFGVKFDVKSGQFTQP